MKKTLVFIVAAVLLVAVGVGGTLAWITTSTTDVENVFTVGNINITLAETYEDFKMVPGNDIDKDPVVTVEAGSEACYLFVKIVESANLDEFITYAVAEGWTQLVDETGANVAGVYYRTVAAGTADQEFSVLAGDQVTVLDTVTKAMLDAIEDGTATAPTLTFTAYAVQQANIATAIAAWNALNA